MGGKGEGGQDIEGEKEGEKTCQEMVEQCESEVGQTQLHFTEAISGSLSYTI